MSGLYMPATCKTMAIGESVGLLPRWHTVPTAKLVVGADGANLGSQTARYPTQHGITAIARLSRTSKRQSHHSAASSSKYSANRKDRRRPGQCKPANMSFHVCPYGTKSCREAGIHVGCWFQQQLTAEFDTKLGLWSGWWAAAFPLRVARYMREISR